MERVEIAVDLGCGRQDQRSHGEEGCDIGVAVPHVDLREGAKERRECGKSHS